VKKKSKYKGEVVTITLAVLAFVATMAPLAYQAYTKHKEYKEKTKGFIHSDITVSNKTNSSMTFKLYSSSVKYVDTKYEFGITVPAHTDNHPITDYIEDEIKKTGRLMKGVFTNNNDITIRCPTLSLQVINHDVEYRLIGTATSDLRCEYV
jgi:hypothetical protein